MSNIPRNWRYVKIDEVATRSSGHTPDKKIKEYWGGEIKWISLKDTKKLDNGYIYNTEDHTTSEGIRNSSAVLLPTGTIVISRDATVGKVGIMSESMATSQHFINYTCSDKINNIFLYYYLQSIKSEFEKVASGSTIKTIGLGFFRKLSVILPPLNEQQKIAEIFSTWDSSIEKQEQLIEKKKEFKKGLMQRLLSGEIRLNEAHNEWKEYKFSQLLKEVKRDIIFEDDKLYDLISVRRRSGGLFHRESLMGKEIKTKKLKSVEIGDFLISKMQIVHGAAGLVTKTFKDMYISDSYIALIPKDNRRLDVEYLNYISKTLKFYNQTFRSSYGVHIEKMTFNLELFMNEKIKLPNIDEQKNIVSILKTIDKEIELLEKELEALKLQKKGLMQRLLTGEVRVKV